MLEHWLNEDTYLRIITMQDAEEIYAEIEASRGHLQRWLAWIDNTKTVLDVRRFVQAANANFARNDGLTCCIRFQGRVAGIVSFNTVDWRNRKTELAYWLGERYQGRGIITRACQAFTDHAFTTFKLNRVSVSVAVENHRSRAVPERLGFVQEATLRQVEWLHDRFVDHVVYAQLAGEWEQRPHLRLQATRKTPPARGFSP